MLGNRIKEARNKAGFSQKEIAKKLNVSRAAISWIESDSRTPTLEHFEMLLDILDLDANYALGRERHVDIVSESSTYHAKISEKELEMIIELRKYKNTYNKIMEDPKRKVELIDRRLN